MIGNAAAHVGTEQTHAVPRFGTFQKHHAYGAQQMRASIPRTWLSVADLMNYDLVRPLKISAPLCTTSKLCSCGPGGMPI